MLNIWVWLIVVALLLIGLVGTIVPALPGMGLIFLGILVYATATDFSTIAPLTVLIFGIIAFLGWLAGFVGSAWGAKIGGGHKVALIGTFIGAIGGLSVMGPPGLIAGAFAGGLLGALVAGQSEEMAVKVAVYSVVGILGGVVMQFLLATLLIVAFIIAILT